MTPQCTWPGGYCQHWAAEQNKPDPFGRVWMHCEEGLSMSKASLARFMTFCLTNNVELGSVSAFQPSYSRSLVLASVRLKPEQFAAFEYETGGRLREPPRVHLNSGDTQKEASPCNGVCTLVKGRCVGCGRTIEEIREQGL